MGLKSECVCVVTQGWLSHKMLPLAGKRGMARCRMVLVWYGTDVVWFDKHKILPPAGKHGMA